MQHILHVKCAYDQVAQYISATIIPAAASQMLEDRAVLQFRNNSQHFCQSLLLSFRFIFSYARRNEKELLDET